MARIPVQFILLLFFIIFHDKMVAQEWEFAKEKDDIKVYTRPEEGSKFKAFRGETDVRSDVSSVCALVEDVKNFDIWDEDVTEIRVLAQEAGKMLQYYVVYDVPWPFEDRDLCIEADITTDEASGARFITARALPDAVPLKEGLVRIVKYWQKWIITSDGNGIVHLEVEGFAEPAGDIPAWIANMAITDSPLNMLRSIRKHFE